jgi:beta-galactosidase
MTVMRLVTVSSGVLLAILAAAPLLAAVPVRVVQPLNSEWKFYKGDDPKAAETEFADAAWQAVSLPHTYNAEDALPGPKMYQGPAWYRRHFTAPAAWKGRRVFVRFGAASMIADVYLNGVKLGQHQGAFAAFCFELTQGLRVGAANTLAVRVDNRRNVISPLGGDFTIFGGLYRTASLIVTGPVAITPLDFAGPGVYLKQVSVTAQRAEVEVTTKVTNGAGARRAVSAVVTVLDSKGKKVLSGSANAAVEAGGTGEAKQTLTLQKAHLWNGVKDPYLYTARIELFDGKTKVDEIEQPLGLRSFSIDPKRGAILNGEAMQIHGVCRHQDGRPQQGWAVTHKDLEEDVAIMREMGVNGVRLAHYQHDDYFHTLADRNGLLVWSELALVNNIRSTEEFRLNVRQQLTELIRQNFNHPSIVMWSMYNEINRNAREKDPAPLVKELSDLAHAEDPARPTTGAGSADTMENLPGVMRATDLISLNLYPGWYFGAPSELGRQIPQFNEMYGNKGVSISEYGGGASIKQHQQNMTERPAQPNGHWHPEEWQAILHEGAYPEIRKRPEVWGGFLWVIFDFASAGRNEGDLQGINDKGLVTRDRLVRKDAFFYYKANWNPEPMVYITSRRDVERTDPVTAVKVYSNAAKVALRVNGKPVEMLGSGVVFTAAGVKLNEGANLVEVDAVVNGKTVRDSCNWNYRPGQKK